MYLDGLEYKGISVSSVKEWINDAIISNNHILKLIAGTIYVHEKNYNAP